IVFIGFSSGVGYFLWLWALKHASATRVTVFLALSPLTAAVLGALLLRERISPLTTLGLALVALGLWLAHRPGPALAPASLPAPPPPQTPPPPPLLVQGPAGRPGGGGGGGGGGPRGGGAPPAPRPPPGGGGAGGGGAPGGPPPPPGPKAPPRRALRSS